MYVCNDRLLGFFFSSEWMVPKSETSVLREKLRHLDNFTFVRLNDSIFLTPSTYEREM